MPDADLTESKQKFQPGDLVELFELDLTDLGGGFLRFTSSAYTDQSILFDGLLYAPLPVEASGFQWDGTGPLPTPTLRISNVLNVVSSVIQEFSDVVGARFTRIRTFRQFLDLGSDPDPLARFPDDIYVVERKTNQNKVFVEWELSAKMDQEGKILPGRQCLKDSCTHRYRQWDGISAFDYSKATCPYVGVPSFDRTGSPVADPEDQCGKKLTDCRLRFGIHGILPTRAFPGMARIPG